MGDVREREILEALRTPEGKRTVAQEVMVANFYKMKKFVEKADAIGKGKETEDAESQ